MIDFITPLTLAEVSDMDPEQQALLVRGYAFIEFRIMECLRYHDNYDGNGFETVFRENDLVVSWELRDPVDTSWLESVTIPYKALFNTEEYEALLRSFAEERSWAEEYDNELVNLSTMNESELRGLYNRLKLQFEPHD